MAISNSKDLELRIKAFNETGAAFSEATNNIKKFVHDAEEANKSQTAALGGVTSAWAALSNGILNAGSSISTFFSGIGTLASALISIVEKVGMAVYEIVKGFIDVNSEFEKMKINMDVLTKGHGEEWFNKLNNWAINMPVSMSEVSKGFTIMNAYGLKPSLKTMKDIIDVAVLLPEAGRAVTGISRALGEIQAQGHLEGKNLRMLASWAVPGFEAIKDLEEQLANKLGISVKKMKYTMIDAKDATKAILAVMEERFGGSTERLSHSWSGMTAILSNYWKEFIREVGDTGLFKDIEKKLETFLAKIKSSFKSGEFQKFTKFIGDELKIAFAGAFGGLNFNMQGKSMENFAKYSVTALSAIIDAVDLLRRGFLGIKLVLLVINQWIQTNVVVWTAAIYGVVWLFNKVIQGAAWLAKKNPLASVEEKANIDAKAKESEAMVKSLEDRLSGSAAAWSQNLTDIKKTADEIVESADKAEIAKLQLKTTFNEYLATPTRPPKYAEPPAGKEPPEAKVTEVDLYAMFKLNRNKMRGLALQVMGSPEVFDTLNFGQKMSVSFQLFVADLERDKMKRIKQAMATMYNDIQTGLGTTFTSILEGNMSFAQSFTAMGKVIRDSFFKILSDMTAKFIMENTVMLAYHKWFEDEKTVSTAGGNVKRSAIAHLTGVKDLVLMRTGTTAHVVSENTKTISTTGGNAIRSTINHLTGIKDLILTGTGTAAHVVSENVKTVATVEGNVERTAANVAGESTSIAMTILNGLIYIKVQAYKAAAAMWAFFANLGPFGWIAGGVAAGAAIATIMAFGKKIGSFETGTGLLGVGETGPALLHKGEIVLNKKESDIFRESRGGSQQAQNINLTFSISALDGADVEKIVRKKIIPVIRENIRDFGKGRTMIKEALR